MTVIDDIKQRIDLVDVVQQTVNLKRTGKNYIGFCPFHSNTRTPSFVVFPRRKPGAVLGSVMRVAMSLATDARDNLDFPEVLSNWQIGQVLFCGSKHPRRSSEKRSSKRFPRSWKRRLSSSANKCWKRKPVRKPSRLRSQTRLER